MSFGWSAGDIAAAITLFIDVVQAVDDVDGTATDYRNVASFLNSLIGTITNLKTFSGCLRSYQYPFPTK